MEVLCRRNGFDGAAGGRQAATSQFSKHLETFGVAWDRSDRYARDIRSAEYLFANQAKRNARARVPSSESRRGGDGQCGHAKSGDDRRKYRERFARGGFAAGTSRVWRRTGIGLRQPLPLGALQRVLDRIQT